MTSKDVQKRKPRRQSLTVKQEKFVEALVRTGNGRQAAIAAGYPAKSAAVIERLRFALFLYTTSKS